MPIAFVRRTSLPCILAFDIVSRSSLPLLHLPKSLIWWYSTSTSRAMDQEKTVDVDLTRYLAWMESGQSINANLRNSKEFHNPSILTGLINICGIKETGSNIPVNKEALSFAPSDSYTLLLAAQDQQSMARSAAQQPGKRNHIEFVKRPNTAQPYGGAPDAKRFKR